VLVDGTEADAEALREEIAGVLEPLGLRLSPAKTRIVRVPRAQEGEVVMWAGDLDRLCCCVEDEGCGPSASLFGERRQTAHCGIG